ncbi:hypothetical protein B0H19DRAFT_1231773 [Mycena capillaripes]|nr:hypothetical protein B0H19DRAFT_1231773 [Mycena capillaripes]
MQGEIVSVLRAPARVRAPTRRAQQLPCKYHWVARELARAGPASRALQLLDKASFNSKSHDFDSKHLAEAVGLNIHGISSIRDRFPGIFGFKKNQGKHKDADTTNDLNALGVHYRYDRIMQYIPGRNGHVVPNEFYAGFDILDGGKLEEFLERTTRNSASVQPENDAEPLQDDEGRIPANSITSGAGGILDLTQFILGDS